jgi:hypothetical protein
MPKEYCLLDHSGTGQPESLGNILPRARRSRRSRRIRAKSPYVDSVVSSCDSFWVLDSHSINGSQRTPRALWK